MTYFWLDNIETFPWFKRFPPTLRAAVLLPVRLHQLREEGFHILVVLLQHARGAGRGRVQVHDFSGAERVKFQIVEHVLKGFRVSATIRARGTWCPHVQVLHSNAGVLSHPLQTPRTHTHRRDFDANGVLGVKHARVAAGGACARSGGERVGARSRGGSARAGFRLRFA